MPFFIIFILIPLAEIYAFIHVGDKIGILYTLLICLLTAMIGGFLVRRQGLDLLFKGQKALQAGAFPSGAALRWVLYCHCRRSACNPWIRHRWDRIFSTVPPCPSPPASTL